MEPGTTPPASYRPLCAPDFEPLLEQFDRRALDDNPGVVFGRWADYRLAYVNAAWFRFAAENGGEPAISIRWPLGSTIISAVPAVLRPHYINLYTLSNTPDTRISGPVSREYECSSAEAYRRFVMQVYTLAHGRGDSGGEFPVDRAAA